MWLELNATQELQKKKSYLNYNSMIYYIKYPKNTIKQKVNSKAFYT